MKDILHFCELERIELGYSTRHKITPSPLTLSFPRGKTIALLGPNGSGKTTLMRALAADHCRQGGIIRYPQGSIPGISAKNLSSFIAVVPQEQMFPPDLRISDFLKLAYLPKMGLFGKIPGEAEREIKHIVDKLSLESLIDRSLGQLSTGERQRALLGRALLQKPKVLLLDEPTNHLDPGGVKQFWNLFVEAKRQSDFEAIISTHDLEFAKQQCQWVCALRGGEVFFNGPAVDFWELQKQKTLYGI